MAAESSGFRLVRRLLKALAIGLGFVTTLLSLMAVVGLLTENGWIRVLVALVVALAVPAVLSDRLLPDDVERARGLPSDVLALVWVGFPLAFAVGFNAVIILAFIGVAATSRDWDLNHDVLELRIALYFNGGFQDRGLACLQ